MFIVTVFVASISYGQSQFVFNSSAGTAVGVQTDSGTLPAPQALVDLASTDFSVNFQFDENLANLSPLAGVGAFTPVESLTVNIDGNELTANNVGEIVIRNDGFNGEDRFTLFFEDPLSGPTIGGFDTVSFSLLFEDADGNAFSSVDLPTTQFDGADFTVAIAGLRFSDSTSSDNSGGSIVFNLQDPNSPPPAALIESLFGGSVVPEPTSAALIALAGLSFGACRQRR